MDTLNAYRFGFNGKENDKESKTQDYGMRINYLDLGRFLSVDPLMKDYPCYSPYQFAGNMPIWAIDLDGLEPAFANTVNDEKLGRIDNYADKGTGQNFKITEGAIASMVFDAQKRLTGYVATGDNQSYEWDPASNDFAAIKPSYDDATNLYSYEYDNNIEVSAKKPAPAPSFWNKYFYWAEEGYLAGHDNPTLENKPTTKETYRAIQIEGKVLKGVGICITPLAPEAGIPLYTFGDRIETIGDAIELANNLVNKKYSEGAVKAIGLTASKIGGTIASDAIKKGGGGKIEQFAADAIVDQAVSKATNSEED